VEIFFCKKDSHAKTKTSFTVPCGVPAMKQVEIGGNGTKKNCAAKRIREAAKGM